MILILAHHLEAHHVAIALLLVATGSALGWVGCAAGWTREWTTSASPERGERGVEGQYSTPFCGPNPRAVGVLDQLHLGDEVGHLDQLGPRVPPVMTT